MWRLLHKRPFPSPLNDYWVWKNDATGRMAVTDNPQPTPADALVWPFPTSKP